jgi:hypothetical protein
MALTISKLRFIILALVTVTAFSVLDRTISAQTDKPEAGKLVYADFEKMENGRPVSNGGGLVQLFGGQETTPVQFKVARRSRHRGHQG